MTVSVGDLIKFKKTGVLALVLKVCQNEDYKAVYLQVLGDALAGTACADGFTWSTGTVLQRQAEVVSASR